MLYPKLGSQKITPMALLDLIRKSCHILNWVHAEIIGASRNLLPCQWRQFSYAKTITMVIYYPLTDSLFTGGLTICY